MLEIVATLDLSDKIVGARASQRPVWPPASVPGEIQG